MDDQHACKICRPTGCGRTLQVLAAVEDSYGEVDEARKEVDALEWDMRNEQRRLAAESQNPTPVKGAAQQPAAAQRSLATVPCLLQEQPATDAQQQSQRRVSRKAPAVTDVIELDSDSS